MNRKFFQILVIVEMQEITKEQLKDKDEFYYTRWDNDKLRGPFRWITTTKVMKDMKLWIPVR